jgi:hypothetical protein
VDEHDRAVARLTAERATARKDTQRLAVELGGAEAERRRIAREAEAERRRLEEALSNAERIAAEPDDLG